ncbi:MAG: inositol monophosphatase family protein, partial [bacterium]|nr:inositol monophosphatase family protein [bacterium]
PETRLKRGSRMSPLLSLHPLLARIASWLQYEVQPIYRKTFAQHGGGMQRKSDGTYAGNLDRAIAESCRKEFSTTCPVVTEEDAQVLWPPANDAKTTILLDPLDGTHNDGMGQPSCGTQAVVVEDGSVTVSAILRPWIEEVTRCGLYVAVRGKGAYRCGGMPTSLTRLAIAQELDLTKACVLFEGSTGNQRKSAEVAQIKRLARRHRINPSCAESGALIAHGSLYPTPAHALVAVDNAPWDNLPPALLIEEAGGKVTDFQGQPWGLTTRNLVAANPQLHAAILAAMHNQKE